MVAKSVAIELMDEVYFTPEMKQYIRENTQKQAIDFEQELGIHRNIISVFAKEENLKLGDPTNQPKPLNATMSFFDNVAYIRTNSHKGVTTLAKELKVDPTDMKNFMIVNDIPVNL